jgi:hypothetical protein
MNNVQYQLHSQGCETEVLTECIEISKNVLIKVVIYIFQLGTVLRFHSLCSGRL